MPRLSSSIEPVEFAAEPLELFRRAMRRRCDGCRSGGFGVARPASQRPHQEEAGDQDRETGKQIAGEIEALLGGCHQRDLAVLLHELVDDLLRRLPLPREPEDVLVQRRAVRAGEVGRATRVDVEPAAAGAPELLFGRLDAGVGVEGGDGVSGAARPLGIVDAPRLHRVLYDGAGGGCGKREKSSPAHLIAHRSASSFTAYPACMRGGRGPVPGGGPPPGQRTIKPPMTSTKPPNQTHQTSGLIVKRKTACSVPFTRPASTTYRSTRSPLMIPTSVEGSNVGLPRASTCWRFSVRRRPMALPSRRTSSSAAVTCRLRALYCEMPRCVKVYTCPSGPWSVAVSPGRSVACVSVLKAMPANATNSRTIATWTM